MKLLIFRIAWRNIWRNTRRTVITLVTMIICVGIMVWMITLADGMHEQMIDSALNLGLGSIQIHAQGYQEDRDIELALFDPEPFYEIAQKVPGVEGITTRLTTFGLMSHGNSSQGGMIIGVDPANEPSVSVFSEKIPEGQGEWLPVVIGNESRLPIIIGSGLAKKLDIGLGDRVFLTIQRFTGDIGYAVYFVHGIYTTGLGELDKSLAYVPIDTLRDVMTVDVARFENAAHEITLLLDPHTDLHKTTDLLRTEMANYMAENPGTQEIEVLNWEHMQPGLRQMIDIRSQAIYFLMMFMYIIVAAGIMNTFLMAVFERIREFGILMSLGTRPISVFNLIMTESAIIGLIGGLLGLALGLLAAWLNILYPWDFDYGEMSELINIDLSLTWMPKLIWANVLKAVIGILSVTILAALYPATKAATLKPVEALRHV